MDEKKTGKAEQEELLCTCTKCFVTGHAVKWNIMNVGNHPELMDRLRNLSMFQWKCPNCGHVLQLRYPCIYYDEKKKLIFWLVPQNISEEEAQNLFGTEILGYQKRVCNTPEELAEKIAISEENLDDRAVELMKLVTLQKMRGSESKEERMFFFRKNEKNNLEFTVIKEKDVVGIELELRVYNSIYAIVQEEFLNIEDKFQKINQGWAVSVTDHLSL